MTTPTRASKRDPECIDFARKQNHGRVILKSGWHLPHVRQVGGTFRTRDVEFSLEAAVEVLRITGAVVSAALELKAVVRIRGKLEKDPTDQGAFLSEGLYFIDEDPLRTFLLVDVDAMVVEATDFPFL